MAQKNLTDKFLEHVSAGQKPQIEVFDAMTAGLAIRVTSTGKKTWSFTFTSPRDQKRARITVGTYPATSLSDARTRAVKAQGQVEAGTDPRDFALQAVIPKTMAELIEERLALEVRGKLRTAEEIERRYMRDIVPQVGSVPVKDFQIDPHYNKVIDPFLKADKLRTAGVLHTDLNTLMDFAERRGVIEFSRIRKTQTADPKNVRTRNLTPAEIVIFWRRVPQVFKLSKTCQRVLKLCLVLGQRVSEVSGMSKLELAMMVNNPLWTIPAERVKNGKKYGAHVVPLPTIALEIIRDALREAKGNWLFPNDAGDGPLTAEVIASTVRRANEPREAMPLGKFGIPKWTPHDLRRTVGTQMLNKANGLEIPKFDKYLVLNHRSATKGNVSDEVYDQNEYLEEKREALDKWGAFLARLVGEELQQREAA